MACVYLQDLANIFRLNLERWSTVKQRVFFEKKLLESHVLCSDKRKTWYGKDQKRGKNVLE